MNNQLIPGLSADLQKGYYMLQVIVVKVTAMLRSPLLCRLQILKQVLNGKNK